MAPSNFEQYYAIKLATDKDFSKGLLVNTSGLMRSSKNFLKTVGKQQYSLQRKTFLMIVKTQKTSLLRVLKKILNTMKKNWRISQILRTLNKGDI